MKKFILFLSIISFSSLIYAAGTHSSLDELRSKIKHVQSDLTTQQSKRTFYEKQLKQSESKANELAQKLQSTTQSLKQQKMSLTELETHAHEYQDQLNLHEGILVQQLKATYLIAQDSYLKLMLSQKDPENTDRILQYYRYIHEDRMQNINELRSLIGKVDENQQHIKSQSQELANLKMQQQQEQLKLNIVQQDRKQVLQVLNKDIQTKNQKLQELLVNKRALENTLTHLNQRSTQFVTTGKSFEALKAQLNWPTQGHIVQAYGTSIEQSELRASGVLIAAPLGQAVHAIASGKVIFAKWMTGYGLLLIIDHGNHYMSLYGRNHVLYKKEGEVVTAGEQIATVGNSGGYQSPELYFALRHNSDPLNPSAWMRGKP